MTECDQSCSHCIYHLANDCCRAKWLATSFAPHALAMLDRWQQQDSKTMGQQNALKRRKAVVAMAKKTNKAGANE